jgi:hypothetical protein
MQWGGSGEVGLFPLTFDNAFALDGAGVAVLRLLQDVGYLRHIPERELNLVQHDA